jgi:hypothetical protein
MNLRGADKPSMKLLPSSGENGGDDTQRSGCFILADLCRSRD